MKLSSSAEIVVLYSITENDTLDQLKKYPNLFKRVDYYSIGNFMYQNLSSELKKYPNFEAIVFEYSNWNLTSICFLLFKKRKVIFWGHGYNREDKGGKNKLSVILKRKFGQRAEKIITYTQGGKIFLQRIGLEADKIFVAWNSIERTQFQYTQQVSIRKFKNRKVAFIGRLIPEKGVELALEVFERVKHYGFSMEVIGGGDALESLREAYPEVVFHGSLNDIRVINDVLSECTFLICPGYLGLNIVDALNNLLPIISVADGIDQVFHSPEYEYIQGRECFISVDALKVSAFEEAIKQMVEDYHQYDKKVQSIRDVSNQVSLERMVEGFTKALK
ncbi:glycosyltransferase [Marinoscillum sp.]|uniref:glycosyltransferase n=1 Tax=Marinoscillum sp. TaxID=2024838 RepID=UPI003BABF31D